MQVDIYTDGACLGNPGPGGWAAILLAGRHRRELSGGEPETTNNRMELAAAIAGLEALRKPCEVRLYTDSRYLKQGITEWVSRWQTNGWRTTARRPVENRLQWEQLLAAAAPHRIEWKWVKAHAGIPENERADELARGAAQQFTTQG